MGVVRVSHVPGLSRGALAALAAAALLLAACGGDDATIDATTEATVAAVDAATESTAIAAPPSGATAPSPSPTAPEPQTATAAPPPPSTVVARADGLTGAPVPVAEAPSAEFEADKLNLGAGRFPPLDRPAVVPASEATWLRPTSLVLGALQNGEARAYPLFMMTFHHVANDELGGGPYLVTF